MNARAWLIDASIYIFRAWFSMPDRWHTAEGMPVNAVYGYASFLHDFIVRTSPAGCIAAAFDESLGSCFRNDLYPGYKASRELPDESLAFQLNACRELTELAGICCFGGPRYEADDYLASLAQVAAGQGVPVTVVTRDKDLGQLLRTGEDQWWDFAADQLLNITGFVERFGVRPDQFADYLALVGDSVDDIPGVPGVGPKTAAILLQNMDSLENMQGNEAAIAELAVRGAATLAQKLNGHWPQIQLSQRLAQLECEVPGVETLPVFNPSRSAYRDVARYLASLNLLGPIHNRWQSLADEVAVP